ncbi:MAG: class I SAM-dependent methyltransferase [Caldilineaceae bacterium]|nr:class I SAM-dependent methyltransferase [Caldilineaceae bacterium]
MTLSPLVQLGRRLGLGKVKRFIRSRWNERQEAWFQRHQVAFAQDLSFTEMAARFPERNDMHAYAVHYYAHNLPDALRQHRTYYKQSLRGFGENAFHAMWWMLLREYQPGLCLEIGVYRGQVISLWAMIAQIVNFSCEIHGISPFTPLGDAVSVYREDVDYLTDTLNSFKHLNLPAPTLVKALSTEPAAIEHIASHSWDLIYIDGNHDYEIVLADYRLCRDHLAVGGLLVMDDASVNTAFRPPQFSFAGHPGPSQVMAEYAMHELQFLGAIGHNNIFQKI